MVFLTPTYKPVGGVVKIFDYVTHARSLGFAATVHCPEPRETTLPIFQIDRFGALDSDPKVSFAQGFGFGLGPDDFVFFSWPTHHEHVAPRMTPLHEPVQTILIVQNVRWANPAFAGGYAFRLLGRPMARIMVTQEVADAVSDLLNPATPSRVIIEGHDWPFFSKDRNGGFGRPVRVAYTTWKSPVGIEAESRLASDERFVFRSIRETVDWEALRELYHWADVFLACPSPEEGFYLPGLEAMAAGAVVVIPDVGGNRAYCSLGENCIEVEYDDAGSYENALIDLVTWEPDRVAAVRSAGYGALESHRLDREREEFGRFISELDELIARSRL